MSICKDCFHSYVCEQFNEHREYDNKKCHFANDHFVSADIINRQKEEKETMQAYIKALIAGQETLQKYIAEKNAEIERLKDALTDNEYGCCVGVKNGLIYTHTIDDYDWLIGDISAEAIKDFAERLKTKASDFEFGRAVWVVYIDNLVKEMVGDV